MIVEPEGSVGDEASWQEFSKEATPIYAAMTSGEGRSRGVFMTDISITSQTRRGSGCDLVHARDPEGPPGDTLKVAGAKRSLEGARSRGRDRLERALQGPRGALFLLWRRPRSCCKSVSGVGLVVGGLDFCA